MKGIILFFFISLNSYSFDYSLINKSQVEIRNKVTGHSICPATVIGPTTIIGAAHCFSSLPESIIEVKTYSGHQVDAAEIKIGPGYKKGHSYNDIGIIRTKSPLFGAAIAPIQQSSAFKLQNLLYIPFESQVQASRQHEVQENLLTTYADFSHFRKGLSGSGFFSVNDNGDMGLVSVLIRGEVQSMSHLTSHVFTPELIKWIKSTTFR